jgi:hypothetical protein
MAGTDADYHRQTRPGPHILLRVQFFGSLNIRRVGGIWLTMVASASAWHLSAATAPFLYLPRAATHQQDGVVRSLWRLRLRGLLTGGEDIFLLWCTAATVAGCSRLPAAPRNMACTPPPLPLFMWRTRGLPAFLRCARYTPRHGHMVGRALVVSTKDDGLAKTLRMLVLSMHRCVLLAGIGICLLLPELPGLLPSAYAACFYTRFRCGPPFPRLLSNHTWHSRTHTAPGLFRCLCGLRDATDNGAPSGAPTTRLQRRGMVRWHSCSV